MRHIGIEIVQYQQVRQPMGDPVIEVIRAGLVVPPAFRFSALPAFHVSEPTRPSLHLCAHDQASIESPPITRCNQQVRSKVMLVVRNRAPPEARELGGYLVQTRAAGQLLLACPHEPSAIGRTRPRRPAAGDTSHGAPSVV